jgi:hypothetical protein
MKRLAARLVMVGFLEKNMKKGDAGNGSPLR